MTAPAWDRIKEVFQEALDRPAHERAAWLYEICGEDRALQMEVESLLAKHDELGSFAERPAVELLDQLCLGADSRMGRMAIDRVCWRLVRLQPISSSSPPPARSLRPAARSSSRPTRPR